MVVIENSFVKHWQHEAVTLRQLEKSGIFPEGKRLKRSNPRCVDSVKLLCGSFAPDDVAAAQR